MSDVTLAGQARKRSSTATILRLRVLNNPDLAEIIVGIRTAPFQDVYDPVSNTANLRLVQADFDALLAAVDDSQTIWVNLVYDNATNYVTSFTWTPI